MGEKERFSPPAVGGSSLLVIFAVLCLTVFALLGLSGVQAGGRLSDASAQAVSAYYDADCRAEEILAALRQGVVMEGVRREADGIYAYTCPISDTQALEVRVRGLVRAALAGGVHRPVGGGRESGSLGRRRPHELRERSDSHA